MQAINDKLKTKNGRCILIGAGSFYGIPIEISEDDFVIAADAGYDNCKAENIKPSLIVGDFDSMHVDGIKGETGPVQDLDIFDDAVKAEYLDRLHHFSIDGIPALSIDPVKNDPDMMAAVRLGLKMGYKEFHLIASTGKRIDHTMANVQILSFIAGNAAKGYMYDETQILTVIKDGTATFDKDMQGYFTALALSDVAERVSESGFKYMIKDATLRRDIPTGLSNEFVGREAEISVSNGELLLIYSI